MLPHSTKLSEIFIYDPSTKPQRQDRQGSSWTVEEDVKAKPDVQLAWEKEDKGRDTLLCAY